MKKSTILACLGILFMFISMLIMANEKIAVCVTVTLWLTLTILSFIVQCRSEKNENVISGELSPMHNLILSLTMKA